MRSILAIARRELGSYFGSPVAYVFLAIFVALFGFFFYGHLANILKYAPQIAQYGGLNLNEMAIRPMLMNIAVISLFLVPMVTMRLYAEERKSGTLELLGTAPVSEWQVLLGKFLGAFTLYSCTVLLAALYISLLFLYGDPNWKPALSGILGLLLFGGMIVSLGMLFSTVTGNQIVAGSLTFGLFLLLWLLDGISSLAGGTTGRVLSYLAVTPHLTNFTRGVLDLSDSVYYLSFILLGLFLTARSMENAKGRS